MLFIMNVGQGTNRPEGWVRTNRDSVRIVYIWVRNVWVRTCRGYETTGYRFACHIIVNDNLTTVHVVEVGDML